MRKIDPRLPERLERFEAWLSRTHRIMTIIGWVTLAFTPIWLTIKCIF